MFCGHAEKAGVSGDGISLSVMSKNKKNIYQQIFIISNLAFLNWQIKTLKGQNKKCKYT